MSRQAGGVICIGLSRSAVALQHQGPWPRRRSRVLAERGCAAESPELLPALLGTLDALLGEQDCGGRAARIVVADHWARSWVVTPPGNASRLADCQAAAAARFQSLYGEPSSGWQLQADWQARVPFMACALPLPLLAGLQRVAAAHRLVVLEVLPHFVAAWNRWCHRLQPGGWFGVALGEALLLGAVAGSGLQALRPLRRQADADTAWLRLNVEREATRCLLPPPLGIALCGDVPAAWTQAAVPDWTCTRLDAPPQLEADSAPQGQEPRLARLLAATGVH